MRLTARHYLLRRLILALATALGGGVGSIAVTANLAAQADVDIRSTPAFADIGYDRTVLVVGNRSADPNLAQAAKAYIRFQLPEDFGTATSATLTLTRAVVRNTAWTMNVYALDEGPIPGSIWDELTWPEVNTGTPITATTWNNAPANIRTSSWEFTTGASLVGTFSVSPSSAGGIAGDQYSVAGANLVNFLNRDSNGFVTLMVSRPGVSSTEDQWASGEHLEFPGPTLSVTYVPRTNSTSDNLKALASARWHAWRKPRTNYFTAAWQALYLYEGTPCEFQTYHSALLNSVQARYNQFSAATEAGLDVILGTWEGIDTDAAKLAAYVEFPSPDSRAVTAYMLRDEPAASLFPDLARATAYINRYDARGAIAIVNHLPNWAVGYDRFGLGKADGTYYRTYINKYVSEVSPSVMVNCHYPILANGTDRTNFYENIEYFRDLALTNDIGLMGWALVTAHTNGSVQYRQPSESDLNWMVYSYLAYGASGMFFYNYRFAPSDKFGEGIVSDADGTPRATYYMVRNVCRELDHLWPVLKPLKSLSVFHTGTELPLGTMQYTNGASSALGTLAGDNLIIGTFTNQDNSADNSQYVVMVNKRHGPGLDSASLTDLATFAARGNRPHVSLIDPATGTEVTLTPVNGTYALPVKGGKGLVLKFRPFTPVEAWASGYGLLGAEGEDEADADGDYASNLYEFAFAGNPTNRLATGIAPACESIAENGTNWLQYVYVRRTGPASGLTYHPNLTHDLASAFWTNTGFVETGRAAIDINFEAVTNRVAVDPDGSLYIRLRVESAR